MQVIFHMMNTLGDDEGDDNDDGGDDGDDISFLSPPGVKLGGLRAI